AGLLRHPERAHGGRGAGAAHRAPARAEWPRRPGDTRSREFLDPALPGPAPRARTPLPPARLAGGRRDGAPAAPRGATPLTDLVPAATILRACPLSRPRRRGQRTWRAAPGWGPAS